MIPEQTRLNMGCGFKKLDDHWNVDIEPKCNPDQVLDFEQFPWPYEDNFFTKINADNILEHLGQSPRVFEQVIKEMYRVSADQAEWFINVPHHRCDLFWDDYTHVRPITAKTMKMFDQKVNFESIAKRLSDSTHGLYLGVDLEVYNEDYTMVNYWRDQQAEGMIGAKELNIKFNTMSNVGETVSLWIRVHKPGRYEEWFHGYEK